MVTGMFLSAGYAVKLNSEAGTGRADVIIKEQRCRRALVIEVKWYEKKGNEDSLEKQCADALQQTEKEQYKKNLEFEGYKTVLCYGAAFRGKTCLIKIAE